MPKINQKIELWRGDTKEVRVSIRTDISLANAAARWWAARTPRSDPDDAFLKKEGPALTIDATAKTVSFVIYPDDTTDIPAGDWYHELEIKDEFGRVGRAMVGPFRLHNSLIPPAP